MIHLQLHLLQPSVFPLYKGWKLLLSFCFRKLGLSALLSQLSLHYGLNTIDILSTLCLFRNSSGCRSSVIFTMFKLFNSYYAPSLSILNILLLYTCLTSVHIDLNFVQIPTKYSTHLYNFKNSCFEFFPGENRAYCIIAKVSETGTKFSCRFHLLSPSEVQNNFRIHVT